MLPLLEWAVRAVALFDTLVLLWLGLTVLLNAERREWGTWAAGLAMVLGGLFFLGQVNYVGLDVALLASQDDYWRLSWVAFLAAPALWCLVIAWYSRGPRLRGVRLPLFGLAVLGLATLV